MTDPVFLDVEDVLLIHEEQLPRYGGSPGIRDRGLLESAVAMPRATAGGEFAHEDLFAMASIRTMLAAHGALMALGFTLCGIVGQLRRRA